MGYKDVVQEQHVTLNWRRAVVVLRVTNCAPSNPLSEIMFLRSAAKYL